ncbi:MAG: DUF3450 family protein [Phycisphaerae bacterium]|nr:DUF3450 family protein [Phycisphaerae bacterium]
MNTATTILVKFAFCCVLASFATRANAQLAQQDDPVTTALRQTSQQLEDEKSQFAQELQQQKVLLETLSAQKETLAGDVVDITFSNAKKQSELQQLIEQKAELQKQARQNSRQLSNIRIIASQAIHTLADLLGTLPPSESRDAQRQLLDNFNKTLSDTGESSVDIGPVLELITSLIREGHTSALFTTDITAPAGNTENVRVLRVGQLLYACQSPSGKIYLAITAPGTASGFRWTQELDRRTIRNIKKAIDKARSSSAAFTANLPVDVSGQLTSNNLRSTTTIFGKLRKGGPVMIPLAAVALLAVLLIIERLIFIFKESPRSVYTAESILALCHEGHFGNAADLASGSPKVIARVLNVALRNRHASTQIVEDAIQEAILHEMPRVERFMPTIAILAGVAPLLGLLGTVTGMIATFDMITHLGTGRPQLMAGGISEALITTATGLVIAIPVLLLRSLISSKTDQLVADTERYAATLLNLINEENPMHKEVKDV